MIRRFIKMGIGRGNLRYRTTVEITCTESSPTAVSPLPITITFSAPVTGFVVGDIAAVGFTLTNFAGSGAVYTVDAAFSAGSGTLDIAANVVDGGNEAADQFAATYIYSWSVQPDAAAGQDTYLLSTAPDGNNATASLILRTLRRNLLKFDLSSIPADANIQTATLTLSSSSNFIADVHVTINRILPANAAWTELGATWNHAVASTIRWAGDAAADGGADAGCSVAGTDYSATLMGSFTCLNGDLVGQQYSIPLNVSETIAMLANNAGMVIAGDAATSVGVAASDDVTATRRPRLDITYTKADGADPQAASLSLFAIGDSITTTGIDEVDALGYPGHMVAMFEAMAGYVAAEIPTRCAVGGWKTSDAKAGIDASLATSVGTPNHVIIHLGANDITAAVWGTLTEVGWKADMNYIVAAVHTKWPNAKIWMSPSYRTDADLQDEILTLWDWYGDIVAANPSYCRLGVNTKPIFDGHPELYSDGLHPNHNGCVAIAAAYVELMGY